MLLLSKAVPPVGVHRRQLRKKRPVASPVVRPSKQPATSTPARPSKKRPSVTPVSPSNQPSTDPSPGPLPGPSSGPSPDPSPVPSSAPTLFNSPSCLDAEVIKNVPAGTLVRVTGSTASAVSDRLTQTCEKFLTDANVSTSPGRWYRVVGTGSMLTATTGDPATTFDTIISVYGNNNACNSDRECIVANDNMVPDCPGGGYVQWESTVGVTYYIRVGGYSTNAGSFVLTVASFV